MPGVAEGCEEFDERRFTALLDLAGPSTAQELALRLDQDLTLVSDALTQAGLAFDRHQLRTQSHVLLGIAGTIGANRLYHLSERLNGLARGQEGGHFVDLLAEIRVLLDRLIQRVRLTRVQLTAKP